MKKNDLKEIIKPIVKECIQEVLLTEGLLSSVISEVVAGLNADVIRESREDSVSESEQINIDHTARMRLQETRKRMLDAVGKEGYGGVNVFEGTTPLKSAGTPGASSSPADPLAHVDPQDPGVDISSVFGGKMTNNWGKIVKGSG